ncbi:MAG: hypothetical protein HOP16_04980 [Acidobacteria bacterium]|nr:hypothetical protein [Acidobacteriota bacterium]
MGATLLLVDKTSTTSKGASHDEEHDPESLHLLRFLCWTHLHLRFQEGSGRTARRMRLRRELQLRTNVHVPALNVWQA